MTFVGMDPHEVERLADGLHRQGTELLGLITQVDGLVSHAISVWPGPDSELFHGDWHSTHRHALLAAAEEAAARAAWLRQQIGDQLEISGVGDAVGSLHGDGVTPLSLLDDINAVGGYVNQFLGPLGLLTVLGSNAALTGRYGAAYERFLRLSQRAGVSSGFFRYKAGLNGLFSVNGPGERLARARPLGALGKFFGGAQFVGHSRDAFDSSLSTNERITAGTNAAADGLKMSKLPPLYLGGVLVSTANKIGESAAQADFSGDGFRMVYNEVKRDPGGAVKEFIKSVPNVLGGVL